MKLQAKDIRVGNWVSEDGKQYQAGTSTILMLEMEEGEVEPIPITGEWLRRGGFEKYQWNDSYFKKTVFGHLMITFFKGDIFLYFTNVSYDQSGMRMGERRYVGNLNSTQNVKHVHALQNLTFALTGEEIEFNQTPTTWPK